MSAELDEFLRKVRPGVPGCPEEMMLDAVREALRDFCTVTQVWREWIEPIDTIKSVSEYELGPPADAEVAMVIRVKEGDKRIDPVTVETMDHYFHDWEDVTGDSIRYYAMPEPHVIQFYPTPNTTVTDAVSVRAALKPDTQATSVPRWLLDRYEREIANGALEHLLMIPNRDWTNPDYAQYFGREYVRQRNNVQDMVEKGHSRAKRRVRIPSMGVSRNSRY